jgi:DNA-binding protein H-NS
VSRPHLAGFPSRDVLSMLNVATASINTFGTTEPKADFVPPSEEPVFILTAGQLQDLIREVVQDLKEEISQLREERAQDRAEFDRFKATHKAFAIQATNDIDQIFEAMIKKPTATQKDRADILRALLAANNGKLLVSDARRKMRMPKNKFSELLATCDFVTLKPYHLDGRKKVIILKSELVPGN